ncbi:GyrI-like domain-containing protein [Alloalcanivorax sp. C16-2]|uniref:effector binding domain-containing protein n=1 Tax=Alloalcanivorax TaxID=3020832 RepID=UPI001934B502|nr:GyrI-like domain-containing protein [Alloalcanivorax marinus]
MIKPERERRHGKAVAGIQVRTNQERELRPEDAQLDRLWEKFNDERLAETIPDKAAGSPVYGVYTEYENGAEGDYSVLAGVEVTDETKVPDDFATLTLEAGEYLVFRAQGRMPETAMEAWSQVWHYFEAEDAPQRAFLTDYEVYEGTDRVTLYVGIR